MTNKYCLKVSGFLLFFLISSCATKLQKQSFVSWEQNLSKGEQLIKEGRNNEAIPYLEQALVSLEKSYNPSNHNLIQTNRVLGFANQETKNYKKAVTCYLSALNNVEFDEKRKDSTYFNILNRLSQNYRSLASESEKVKSYKEAISYYLKALDNIELEEKKTRPDYSNVLYRLGINYRRIGNYDESIDFFKRRLSSIDTSEVSEREKYANILNSISISHKYKDDFANALEYNRLSTEIKKDLYGEKDSKYLRNVNSLNQIYYELSKYNIAIPLQKLVLSLYPENEKNGLHYSNALYTLSLLYNGTNEYKKEIKLLNKAKQILSKRPKYKDRIIDINNNLAVAFDNLGDYEKAITFMKDVLVNTSKEERKYPRRLQNLAFYHAKLGEFDKALSIYNQALISCKNVFGTKHSKYAQLVDAVGQLHIRNGKFNKAKALFEEAINVTEHIDDFDESHSEYGFYLNNYARSLLKLGQYDEAIKLLKKNIEITESDSIIDKGRYYRKQHDLASAYILTDEYEKALELLNSFKEAYGLQLGSTHEDYGQLLKSIGKAYIGVSEYENAISYMDSSNNVLISQIDKVFKFRSEKENKEFVKTLVPEFDEFQSILINDHEPMSNLVEMNLNNQLLLKNLLLSQSKRIMDKLVNSNDTSTVNKVYKYKELKSKINKNHNLKSFDRTENLDSLKNILNEKEVELAKLYSDKFDIDISLTKSWEIAKKQLKENEIAIEFANFKHFENNNWSNDVLYVAYIYKNEWGNPKIVNLFEEKKLIKLLNNKTPNQLYATRGSKAKGVTNLSNIYDLVLKPLEAELKNVKTIYFSPSGILNQVPFSAISIKKNERLIDKYKLIRLSATSKISKLEPLTQPNDIIFFGGVEYDFSLHNQVKDSTLFNLKELEAFKTSNSNLRDSKSWKYLPGTLAEIENIKSQFENKNKSNKVLKGKSATEEEFKKLDGNSPKIIHIATHGFFYENLKDKTQNTQLSDSLSLYTYAEDPLLRSGLILAGGNYAWKNGVNLYGKEDGILTAMEISNLDLSNTDLVVLSACETGLGDIEGSEGVYGLQRAFKIAGVDIVIMSLWEVPDKETAEFMEHLYSNWLNGMALRDAFNETQRLMSNKYSNQPEKWAAFVLFE